MAVSSLNLAAAAANRLNDIAPAGFQIRAYDSDIVVYFNGTDIDTVPAAGILEDIDDRTDEARLESALMAILEAVQDSICEQLHEPWPVGVNHEMGLPDVRVEAGTARAWFGDEKDPVIELAVFTSPDWTHSVDWRGPSYS